MEYALRTKNKNFIQKILVIIISTYYMSKYNIFEIIKDFQDFPLIHRQYETKSME